MLNNQRYKVYKHHTNGWVLFDTTKAKMIAIVYFKDIADRFCDILNGIE